MWLGESDPGIPHLPGHCHCPQAVEVRAIESDDGLNKGAKSDDRTHGRRVGRSWFFLIVHVHADDDVTHVANCLVGLAAYFQPGPLIEYRGDSLALSTFTSTCALIDSTRTVRVRTRGRAEGDLFLRIVRTSVD